jgi:eukaryotic-like serine/threonine-protein kinase
MVEKTQQFASDSKSPKGSGEGALQVGSVLQNRYKITGVLGVGGMGSVYLARDMHFPTVVRNVAVKEMTNLATDPQLRELTLRNFEREANILAELSHPAIPKIYDYFANKDRAYLVMEYINGKDLEAIISSVPDFLPFEMVKKWALELCDVLNYLHTRPEPIIFRDMKPSNVMIDSGGNVRLIDFGIAKTFQSGSQKGTQIGTEGYSPPEQYRGEATPSGDVYALGATLHHILTRNDPRLEAPFSFLERPINKINANVPEGFVRVVTQALTYNPLERFSNAALMKTAIEDADRGAGNAAASKGGPVVPRTQYITDSSGKTTTIQNTKAWDSKDSGIQPVWKFRCEDEVRVTPVHSKGLLYVGAYDNNLYCISATDGSFKWKFPTEGGIAGSPAVAVEENLVIFGSEDHTLYAVDVRTGKVSWTYQTGAPIRGGVNVSHGHAFFGSDDGRLYAVRLMNGRLAWKFDAGSPVRCRPTVTDDRIVVGAEDGMILGLDLSGSAKWRYRAKRSVMSSAAVHDQIAYIGSLDWHVYAVDVQQGYAAWRYRTQNAIVASPALAGRALLVGSVDGYLYALDIANNGKEMWKFKTEGQVVASPIVTSDAVYFGGVDQYIYSLELKKGNLRWKYQTGGAITAAPCIVNNMLIVGSTDRYVYALNI